MVRCSAVIEGWRCNKQKGHRLGHHAYGERYSIYWGYHPKKKQRHESKIRKLRSVS